MQIPPSKLVAIAGAIGALITFPIAARAAGASTVSLSIAQVCNMTATGSANLAIGDSNYDMLGNYNFVSDRGAYGRLQVNSNTGWSLRARLNANMPAGPGGGFRLKVDHDRGQRDIARWPGALSN